MSEPLPALMDARMIMDELGVKKNVANKIVREIAADTGVVAPDTIRKVWVERSAVEAWLRANTRRVA